MKGVTLPTETVFVMEASPIKFGLGAMDEIAYDARRLGLKRVLIVTDRHIGELGLPDRVRALLEEEGIKADVYDGVEIEPTDRSMEEAAEYARQRELDGLVAVGAAVRWTRARRSISSRRIRRRCSTTSTSRSGAAARFPACSSP